jgi:hypothetical protein
MVDFRNHGVFGHQVSQTAAALIDVEVLERFFCVHPGAFWRQNKFRS